jgi:hypothetical protein
MPRRTLVALLLVAVFGALPARATTSVSGHVEISTGTPALERALFPANSNTNGVAGFVIHLPATAQNRGYTLRTVSRGVGVGEPDVWFYADLAPGAADCYSPPTSDTGDVEVGTVCDGANWAIVYIVTGVGAKGPTTGADLSFTFTY